ncbi:Scr1 family TA system antitoxin-like transcriptional regulator [Micromonospora maritima]|uniref:Scr1 family TA system antitoxin-like transcriptional regulator n=1 Tax=Micromonospora maritima TaxID=986711 RepID=A0ABW7ZTJ0_9ACTN
MAVLRRFGSGRVDLYFSLEATASRLREYANTSVPSPAANPEVRDRAVCEPRPGWPAEEWDRRVEGRLRRGRGGVRAARLPAQQSGRALTADRLPRGVDRRALPRPAGGAGRV